MSDLTALPNIGTTLATKLRRNAKLPHQSRKKKTVTRCYDSPGGPKYRE